MAAARCQNGACLLESRSFVALACGLTRTSTGLMSELGLLQNLVSAVWLTFCRGTGREGLRPAWSTGSSRERTMALRMVKNVAEIARIMAY